MIRFEFIMHEAHKVSLSLHFIIWKKFKGSKWKRQLKLQLSLKVFSDILPLSHSNKLTSLPLHESFLQNSIILLHWRMNLKIFIILELCKCKTMKNCVLLSPWVDKYITYHFERKYFFSLKHGNPCCAQSTF